MAEHKREKTKNGLDLHYSVGAIIQKDDKYLLISRAIPPYGFACIGGHVEEGETPENALTREVAEESGLIVTKKKLLFEESLDWDLCARKVHNHHWYIFQCLAHGELKENKYEVKSIGWYTTKRLLTLPLTSVWIYWFKKLNLQLNKDH